MAQPPLQPSAPEITNVPGNGPSAEPSSPVTATASAARDTPASSSTSHLDTPYSVSNPGESSRSPSFPLAAPSVPSGYSSVLAKSDNIRPTADFSNDLNHRPEVAQDKGVQDEEFKWTPEELKPLTEKNFKFFQDCGGLEGLANGLYTNLHGGLGGDSQRLEKRQKVFGDNTMPSKRSKSLWKILKIQFGDFFILLLIGVAALSLGAGIYKIVKHQEPDCPKGGTCKTPPPAAELAESLALIVMVLVLIVATTVEEWRAKRVFIRLDKTNENREAKVIRDNGNQVISAHSLLVGDVLRLYSGDMVPADGILIKGSNVGCDESAVTGESEIIKKVSGNAALKVKTTPNPDPFLLSGSTVNEGNGTMLVVATGINSTNGQSMKAIVDVDDTEETPLQKKSGKLGKQIAYCGGAISVLLFLVLLFRSVARHIAGTGSITFSSFVNDLLIVSTLFIVAIPEGFPLAVLLALSVASKHMSKHKNLVRVRRSCETMGHVTTVCTDKTGTLTTNKMAVDCGLIGLNTTFWKDASEDNSQDVISKFSPAVRKLLKDSIVLNSTAIEAEKEGVKDFFGSATETALLRFAKDRPLGLVNIEEERGNAKEVQRFPFNSDRKCMGIVVEIEGGYRLYVKGASEMVVKQCTRRITDPTAPDLTDMELREEDKESINASIDDYAKKALRTIGIVYKDYAQWPPACAGRDKSECAEMRDKSGQKYDPVEFESIYRDMTFLGVFGIRDPPREGVAKAIKQCQRGGIKVIMVTGDNKDTAEAIARECGILRESVTGSPGVMEGDEFRRLSEDHRLKKVENLVVLARSLPKDKELLVKTLKRSGHVVAVTGDGTNDGPALAAAHVGFSMGISGTDIAKKAASIILMDDNFASIVTALMWGRSVNDAVRKFLQFQLTVNVTAVLVTFISAVHSSENEAILSSLQLLWVNAIMDTLAALALATDRPTDSILDRRPIPVSAPLISVNMWKLIVGQAIFQLTVSLVFNFAGPQIFPPHWTDAHVRAMVFNTFVWMQIFNMFNNRRLDNKLNIFENIQKNWTFHCIAVFMVVGQYLIMAYGSFAFRIQHTLTPVMWAVCVSTAALCLPWAIGLRMIPDHVVVDLWNHTLGPVVDALVAFARWFARTTRPAWEPVVDALRPYARALVKALVKYVPVLLKSLVAGARALVKISPLGRSRAHAPAEASQPGIPLLPQ